MSNLARWETAEASEMTPIKSSSPPVVTDYLPNVEPENSQVKKRKKKRQKMMQDAKSGSCGDVSSIANSSLPGGSCLESKVYIGTKSDLKSGLPRDSCLESEVDMSNGSGSKPAEASEMTPIENSTDSLCNMERESSQAKKRNKKRKKVMQDAKSGSCGDVSSIANSSLSGGLCLESEVDMSTAAGSKTAEASEMTPIKNSSQPVVTDSLCNVEPEGSQAKKRNKKRKKATQDSQSDPPVDVSSIKSSSLRRDSCLKSELHISTKLDLKSGQTPEMTPINDTSGPVATNSSQTEKKKKKRQKKVLDDGKSDPPGEVSSLENSSLQRDSCSESAVDVSAKVDSETAQASGMNTISTSPLPVATDYIRNVEFKSSETKNREKKTRTKKKKQKQQGLQDLQLETPGDVLSIKDSSLQRDSPVETAVYTSTKVDLKTSQASETTLVNDSGLPAVPDALCNVESRSSQPKKKKKEKQKRMQDAQSDPSGDVPSMKNSFLERDLCFESEVTVKDLEIAQASGMTAINNCSLQVVTDSDNVKPESFQADKGNKGQETVQDALEDFSGNISSIKSSSLERNFCLEPEVDFSSKGDFERVQPSMIPISNSSQLVLTEPLDERLRTMKKRKKKKIMQDVQADLPGGISSIKNSSIGGDSCCEPEGDICIKADLKTAQSSQISSTQPDRKRKRRKQGKLKATTVDVCVPLEVASTSLLEENAFRAEQQSGFPGNASASLTRYDKELVPLEASSTRLMGQNTLSGISSLMKISDSTSQHDIVSQENEIVQAFQKDDGSLKTYHRKRKSHDALGNSAQPIVQTCDGSANILDVPRVEVHISSIKDVQDNLDEKGSSLSNGKVGFEENGKMTVMKINVDSDGPIMEENTPQVPHFSPKGSHTRCSNRKLLILDINGLLADIVPPSHFGPKPDIRISQKSVFKRPFCDDFLQFCLEKFDVGVWSSRTKKNVELAVNYLFGDLKDKLLFCWDQSHCTKTGFTTIENREKPLVLKELKKLWKHLKSLPGNKGEYDESNTLLLDDSPYKALTNPVHSCLFPRSYSHRAKKDSSIGPGGDLRVYLEQLAEAPNVSEFVAHKPFGQRAISKSSPSWGFYQKILHSL